MQLEASLRPAVTKATCAGVVGEAQEHDELSLSCRTAEQNDSGYAGLGCCQRIQFEACLQASSDEGHLEVCEYRGMQQTT
jgi:hypothetical protein